MTAFNRANVEKLAEGTLTTYDSQVDITTGTIKMRATFDNSKGTLFPQQFVNVRLLIDTLKGVALAPNAAIQIGPTGSFVYLLNADGTVSKRDVVAGPSNSKSTTVTSGLAVGDKVVIDGVDRLRDGAKVTVVGAPGQAALGGGGCGRLRREASPEAKAIYAAAAPVRRRQDDHRSVRQEPRFRSSSRRERFSRTRARARGRPRLPGAASRAAPAAASARPSGPGRPLHRRGRERARGEPP